MMIVKEWNMEASKEVVGIGGERPNQSSRKVPGRE
jgi:hypothetical protein